LSFVVAAVAACSDDTGTDPPATACYDYASFVETPNVSFATDVLPILRRSCGLAAACHQNNPGSLTQPYFGNAGTAAMTPEEIQAIFDENVGVTSSKALGMDIIKAGDPENSFLMHKLDGTLTCATIKGCTGTDCGGTMPIGNKLAAAELDTIRSWIKQGATNN
jgi:hypothetical protein